MTDRPEAGEGDGGDADAESTEGNTEPPDQATDAQSTDDGVEVDEAEADETEADETEADGTGSAASPADTDAASPVDAPDPDLPPDVAKYDRFKKIDGGTYDRANDFLRERTYITAREWAIARLCADFRTETGVEMTKIGENLPELVPFMTDTYTPQAVNQARASFEEKVRKAGATFLYGAMCDFFTAEELDDVMYEATEVAKFLLEVEGVELSVEEELAAEDEISEVMREVREHSAALRHDEVECPDCGHHFEATAADAVDDD
ncbi:DUF5806 family protein [Halosimplex pelagicum]|uniref:Uncharacterized protein n=1 Tax=Halosimplex pelagicum TaxID=869886 RepID=A0A7D5PB35_9EURY|nr:DUF5806 family protein [Halosimplex pelagicum]QLH81498.1 hypothetical protein HZS54_07600 [Halosimplex pelagicum]